MPSSRSSSIPVPLRLVETPESEGPRVTTPTAVFAIGDRADAIRLGPVLGATQRLGTFIPLVVLTGRPHDQRIVCDLGEELGLDPRPTRSRSTGSLTPSSPRRR